MAPTFTSQHEEDRMPDGLSRTATGLAVEDCDLVVNRLGLNVMGHDILTNIDLLVPRGRITVLVGPSGSGKSSLLRVLNRLWDAVPGARVSGQVLYRGLDVYGLGADPVWLRSRIGMVFQRPTPFPRSIYENIALPLRVHGKPSKQIPDLVERALRQAALWDEVKDRLKAPAMTLSGGQQQRLCIARALAIEPDVLLLDEPASALDPNSRARIEELLLALKGQLTMLLVTHHLDQAKRMGDYAAVMMERSLYAFGTVVDVFADQTVPRVYAYLQSPH
jgi:phosphate transport system ATP-binding protein